MERSRIIFKIKKNVNTVFVVPLATLCLLVGMAIPTILSPDEDYYGNDTSKLTIQSSIPDFNLYSTETVKWNYWKNDESVPAPKINRHNLNRRYKSYTSRGVGAGFSRMRDLEKFTDNEMTMRKALRSAGFTDRGVNTMIAIGKAESGLRSNATSPSGTMVGPFQFNLKAHPYISEKEARDPEAAAVHAYNLSGGGKNYRAWEVYTNGKYRQYLR
jgi:hypothetical protein